MSSGLWLLIGTFFVIAVVLIIVVLNLIQRQKRKEGNSGVQAVDPIGKVHRVDDPHNDDCR